MEKKLELCKKKIENLKKAAQDFASQTNQQFDNKNELLLKSESAMATPGYCVQSILLQNHWLGNGYEYKKLSCMSSLNNGFASLRQS